MSPVPMRLAAALAERYRLEVGADGRPPVLGAGGMATVYLAQDLRHDRQVAIKVLRPELAAVIGAERFLSEIRTTANLQHPHILPLFDSGVADSFLYYVMPFIEGESLRDRLNREKQLPIADAVRIATEVAGALDYAHRHNVIHRDIKPENILLHDGRALVADFGIALAASKSGGTRMTETGMSLGTPTYMSPEQAMGEREITARSDVYALGAMTYEMLLGEPPFTGPTAQAIVAKVMTEKPASLIARRDRIPAAVEDAVLTALEKLPADRWASAKEFGDALGRPAGTAFATAARPAAASRPRWLASLPWAVALIAAACALWGWLGRPTAPGPSWHYITFGERPVPATLTPSLALSPDGQSLLITDNTQKGQIWLKRRAELNPVPLPGTDRAFYPGFSPDGQWITFIADGHLKKIRPGEGAAITLADSANLPFGGQAWLDDGTIVFVGPTASELSRVSGAGGRPTTILNSRSVAGLGLSNPTPLPGARGVFFTVCTSGCTTTAVHVLDLKTGEERQLLGDGLAAWYLPTGQVFFVRRDGTGLVSPFDLERLQLTGSPIPVLDHIWSGVGLPFISWSRSGDLIYFQAANQADEFELVRVGRDGAATPIDTAWHGPFNSAVVSPDGRRLAVGVGLAGGSLGIWIKQLERGPFTRLTFSGHDRRPAWSPDGKVVAFIRDSLTSSSVYARAIDGSTPERRLVALDRPIQEVTWSPDGRWLLLRTDNAAPGAGDIVGVRTNGDTTPVPLVTGDFSEMMPAVSPDGRWLAYSSNESGINEIYVRPFPQTSSARWQVSSGGGDQARWSPDGREVYFVDRTGHLVAATLRTGPPVEVTALRTLFDASGYVIPGYHQNYDVLPDGKGLLFIRSKSSIRQQSVLPIVQVDHWFTELRARTAH